MPALVETWWSDAALKGGVQRARKIALAGAAAVAAAKNPAPRHIRVIPVSGSFGPDLIKGTGQLAHIMEGGRSGGYPIQPGLHTLRSSKKGVYGVRGSSGTAIKFTHGDGGFARGPFLGGPMAARPFLEPAAEWWAGGGYAAALSASLAVSGLSGLGIAA